MADTLAGDPFHEGSVHPMDSLKGGMSEVHTQAPMSGENSGSTDGNTCTPMIAGWDTTTIGGGSGGGKHLNPANTHTTL